MLLSKQLIKCMRLWNKMKTLLEFLHITKAFDKVYHHTLPQNIMVQRKSISNGWIIPQQKECSAFKLVISKKHPFAAWCLARVDFEAFQISMHSLTLLIQFMPTKMQTICFRGTFSNKSFTSSFAAFDPFRKNVCLRI